MGTWFNTESFTRWVGNAILSIVALFATSLAAFVVSINAPVVGLFVLLALFGLPLLARLAPPSIARYVGRFKAQERAARARAIELSAVVGVYAVFFLLVW